MKPEKIYKATAYEVRVMTDTDYGLHEADDGYTIKVTPICDGVIVGGVAVQDVTCRIAGQELGFTDFVNAGELYEFCEDGDPKAIEVAEYADEVVRPRLYAWVRIELTPEQIDEIDEKYHDRDGEFATFIEGWMEK